MIIEPRPQMMGAVSPAALVSKISAAFRPATKPAPARPATIPAAAAPIWKNPLVIGGAALAAYMLFMRKKRRRA